MRIKDLKMFLVLILIPAAGLIGCGDSDGNGSDGGQDGADGNGDQIMECHSTFTAGGTVTPQTGSPVQVSMNQPDGVYVISGSSGNTLFEALLAADQPPDKLYMGTTYQFLLDIAEVDSGNDRDSLQPKTYTTLGAKGAFLQWDDQDGVTTHYVTLQMDAGDFMEIETGTTPLYEVVFNPQIKMGFQLHASEYRAVVTGTEQPVPATGTLTGRFDGCYVRHNDAGGNYLN